MKIYIVEGSTGEPSDYCDWIVAAYVDEAHAKRHVELAAGRAAELLAEAGGCNAPGWHLVQRAHPNEWDRGMKVDYTGVHYRYYSVKVLTEFPMNGMAMIASPSEPPAVEPTAETLEKFAFPTGYSRGNYAAAYETTALEEEKLQRWVDSFTLLQGCTLGRRSPSIQEMRAYKLGCVLGFFSSCEDHEIDPAWLKYVEYARRTAKEQGWGEGILDDDPEDDDPEDDDPMVVRLRLLLDADGAHGVLPRVHNEERQEAEGSKPVTQSPSVWVCRLGVFASQRSAIRAAEKSSQKHHASPEAAEDALEAAKSGGYMPVHLMPAPDDSWTAVARRRWKEWRR